jgi:uncharacterized membrane protein YoaK (UPF0700 family)
LNVTHASPLTSATFRRDVLLVALAIIGGWIDAISFLGLGRVFTANMTGNTVLLGVALGQGAGAGAGRAAIALGGFAIGAVAGSRLAGRRRAAVLWPSRVTVALIVEACALVALAVVWSRIGRLEGLVALSALAMGIQSVAVARLAVPGVATTYVTGTLTALLDELGSLTFRDGWKRRAAVWAALLAGAAVGAGVEFWAPGWAAVGPAVCIVMVCAAAAVAFRSAPAAGRR